MQGEKRHKIPKPQFSKLCVVKGYREGSVHTGREQTQSYTGSHHRYCCYCCQGTFTTIATLSQLKSVVWAARDGAWDLGIGLVRYKQKMRNASQGKKHRRNYKYHPCTRATFITCYVGNAISAQALVGCI